MVQAPPSIHGLKALCPASVPRVHRLWLVPIAYRGARWSPQALAAMDECGRICSAFTGQKAAADLGKHEGAWSLGLRARGRVALCESRDHPPRGCPFCLVGAKRGSHGPGPRQEVCWALGAWARLRAV